MFTPREYASVPLPHLGLSKHIASMLASADLPLLKPNQNIRQSLWGSVMLQVCFECTVWQVFRKAAVCEDKVDLQDFTSDVLGYTGKCVEDVTIT